MVRRHTVLLFSFFFFLRCVPRQPQRLHLDGHPAVCRWFGGPCCASHLVLIPQYSAVKFRTVGKMDWINTCTMVICLVIYIPAGLAGYMQLGTATPGDVRCGLFGRGAFRRVTILQSWLPGLGLHFCFCLFLFLCPLQVLVAFGNALDISIGRICIACTCIFSYPLLQFVARTVIEDLLFRGATPSNVRMGVETVFFIGASLAVSIAVPKVEVRTRAYERGCVSTRIGADVPPRAGSVNVSSLDCARVHGKHNCGGTNFYLPWHHVGSDAPTACGVWQDLWFVCPVCCVSTFLVCVLRAD